MTASKTTPDSSESRKRLTDKAFWESRQVEVLAGLKGVSPSWYRHVADVIAPCRSVAEIGVVPGANLLFFGQQLKARCAGVDFSDRVRQLDTVFRDAGIDAEFFETDFMQWDARYTFDFVYSCGFIEHFEDYENVIAKHWEHVAEGGYLILSVPLLSPFQMAVRRVCYTSEKLREVLESHNTKIMNLNRLTSVCQALAGAEEVALGHINGARVWFRSTEPYVRVWSRPLLWSIRPFEKLIGRLGLRSSWFSPECFVCFRKRGQG